MVIGYVECDACNGSGFIKSCVSDELEREEESVATLRSSLEEAERKLCRAREETVIHERDHQRTEKEMGMDSVKRKIADTLSSTGPYPHEAKLSRYRNREGLAKAIIGAEKEFEEIKVIAKRNRLSMITDAIIRYGEGEGCPR